MKFTIQNYFIHQEVNVIKRGEGKRGDEMREESGERREERGEWREERGERREETMKGGCDVTDKHPCNRLSSAYHPGERCVTRSLDSPPHQTHS